MARCIIKIKDKYFEWSSIVDAPVTYGMDLEELKEYIKKEYGHEELEKLDKRLEGIHQWGTGMIPYLDRKIEDFLVGNRAGENGEELSIDEIYEKYSKEV